MYREKVLCTCFTRAMKDNFPHCRFEEAIEYLFLKSIELKLFRFFFFSIFW